MINSVVFDVGNVLVDFTPRLFLEKEVEDEGLRKRLYQAIFANPAWGLADRGDLTEEETLERFVQAAPDQRDLISELYEKCGDTISLFPYAVPWIRELKEMGLRTYVLSNYSKHLYDRTVHKMDFLPLMDGAIFSWQHGCMKPEEAIYRLLLDQYGLDPARTIFLDDLPANLEKAQEMGMGTLHFTNYEEAHARLKRALAL